MIFTHTKNRVGPVLREDISLYEWYFGLCCSAWDVMETISLIWLWEYARKLWQCTVKGENRGENMKRRLEQHQHPHYLFSVQNFSAQFKCHHSLNTNFQWGVGDKLVKHLLSQVIFSRLVTSFHGIITQKSLLSMSSHQVTAGKKTSFIFVLELWDLRFVA